MDVPEFCIRAAPRVTRKKKTDLEADPNYEPEPKSSTSRAGKQKAPPPPPPVNETRKVKRSKVLEDQRRQRQSFKLNVGTAHQDYSIDDWKVKAAQRQQTLKKVVTKFANALHEVSEASLEYPSEPFNRFQSENPYEEYQDQESEEEEEEEQETKRNGFIDFNTLPTFLLGSGRGTPGGPPLYQFRSCYRYDLVPIRKCDDLATLTEHFPWERDVTVPDVEPKILSIVACFSVGTPLDLLEIAKKTRNIEYNPERFAPVIMRIRDPKVTTLIFKTGRITITGAKSVMECKRAARKAARVLQRLGYRVAVINLTIQNISAGCKLAFRVRLHPLSKEKVYGKTAITYEPELFPGLVISLSIPVVKVIVFFTGSVLMTGAKTEDDVREAMKVVYPLLRSYAN